MSVYSGVGWYVHHCAGTVVYCTHPVTTFFNNYFPNVVLMMAYVLVSTRRLFLAGGPPSARLEDHRFLVPRGTVVYDCGNLKSECRFVSPNLVAAAVHSMLWTAGSF